MEYLILRCRNSNTLQQVDLLREEAPRFALQPDDIRCPTFRVMSRVGGNRERVEHDVPILGSFIFVRWPRETYWLNYLEGQFPYIRAMRKPTGGFACCSAEDLACINTIAPLTPPDPDAPPVFSVGEEVKIKEGFLLGITGIVSQYRADGRVRLKILDNKGWKLSALLISAAVLALNGASI